jgi:hypothetical protein
MLFKTYYSIVYAFLMKQTVQGKFMSKFINKAQTKAQPTKAHPILKRNALRAQLKPSPQPNQDSSVRRPPPPFHFIVSGLEEGEG